MIAAVAPAGGKRRPPVSVRICNAALSKLTGASSKISGLRRSRLKTAFPPLQTALYQDRSGPEFPSSMSLWHDVHSVNPASENEECSRTPATY